MCGIAGIYNLKGRSVDPRDIEKMCDLLAHRGPDDEGYVFFTADGFCPAGGKATPAEIYRSGFKYCPTQPLAGADRRSHLALGHRRLSIIDLSTAGHQPMSNEDGSVWVVYNGEIYNYLELRQELKGLGHVFQSDSDTEVLLKAYLEWGTACLEKFNGMWAFVIHDRRKNLLFGARDRFGVKPFYYYQDNEHFAFASEIKALVELPFYKKEINERAVFAYLVLQVEEDEPESFFKNIFDLPPAHYFIYDLNNNNFGLHRYYSLSYETKWRDYDPKTAAEHIAQAKARIFDAVRLRLRSDVPVGSCLSGGLDSSSIVSVISELDTDQVSHEQRAFTASFDSPKDESKYAERVVMKTGSQWYKVHPRSSELLADLEDLVYFQDVPFRNGSTYAEYRVMKLAHEHKIKVLMNGQGGDEIFSGYPPYYIAYFAEIMKNAGPARFLKSLGELDNSPVNAKFIIGNLLKSGFSKLMPFELYASQYRSKFYIYSYLDDGFWQKHKRQLLEPKAARFNSLNAMLGYNLTRTNMKTLLRMGDRNAMRFSIEAQPFHR